MTPDLKGLHYLTAPNQVQLDRKNKAPMIQNDGDMFSYNPYQYRCCQHNAAHAWPYFAEHLWMATANEGLAAVLYSPSKVKAKVAGGTKVEITESTEYPFNGKVTFTIATGGPQVRFPLALRIPAWTTGPRITVNGKNLSAAGSTSAGWIVADQTWRDGDRIVLTLPMAVQVKKWTANGDSVSIYRGPLAYSLKIGERWERYNQDAKWAAITRFSRQRSGIGLVLDPAKADSGIRVARPSYEVGNDQPFTPNAAPVSLSAKARKIRGRGGWNRTA